MASLIRQPNGRKRIQFRDTKERRQSISFGKMSDKKADAVLARIEDLIAAKVAGYPMEQSTAKWLAGLDDIIYERIAKTGLVATRESQVKIQLVDFISQYIEKRSDVKPSTRTTWGRTAKHLQAYFGKHRDLSTITPGDAKDFRMFLIRKELAENTVRRTCGIAKQFFQDAIDRELIDRNPFKHRDIPTTTRGNAARQFFVSGEMSERILEACPNNQWRLIFALSRYGGLRCPSEHVLLRWEDVNWERERLTITSPKTEHHEGQESRVIPLFSEIRPYLDKAFEEAEDGEIYVISQRGPRSAATNLRTQFTRIIKRAGYKPWPKLFHNLRATRQTELIQSGIDPQAVCSVIGNSIRVMSEHYYTLTDDTLNKMLDVETCAICVQKPPEVCRGVQKAVNN